MRELLTGRFASSPAAVPQVARLVTWNIERGVHLQEIGEFLLRSQGTVFALQEVDLNSKRSSNVDVAERLAKQLKLDYALGIAFQELTQGADAFQGQATLVRWAIEKPRVLPFKAQSNFWKPRWWVPNTPPFQERLGGRVGLAAEIPMGRGFWVLYNLHLESRGTEELRAAQLSEVMADANRYPRNVPIVIAGDLNTKHRTSPCIRLLEASGFRDALGDPKRFTTNRGGALARLLIDGALDWIWVRGPLRFANAMMHTDVAKVSDHWPLSVDLSW